MAKKTDISGKSLVEMLDTAAILYPDRGMVIIDEHGNNHRQSYLELSEASKRAAAGWSKWVKKDDRILFSLPTSFDFFAGFFGALRIGALPIPIAPLKDTLDSSDRAEFLWRVAERMQAKAALLGIRESQAAKPPELGVLEIVLDIADLIEEQDTDYTPNENKIAYIQTTSGTTGTRRGVMLEHAAIIENIKNIGELLVITPEDSSCAWLPMYNVLGLIGVSLFSMYHGIDQVLIDPGGFAKNADLWLETISQYRSTLSVAPSHAYHFTARRTSRSTISALDLSSLRALLVGGEAIRKKHLEMFQHTFADAGLAANVFAPVYGLSEATMGVTLCLPDDINCVKISRSELENGGQVELLDAATSEHKFLEFISSGKPISGIEIMLTDARGIEKDAGRIGAVTIRSNTLMAGYFLNSNGQTRLSGDWLITDDVGFIIDDELYIVGKINEMIETQDGRYLFAHEMEFELYDIDGIRLGSSMIFNASPEGFRLVVVLEIEPGALPKAIEKKVLETLYKKFRLRPDDVEILSPHSIPRSPNGKIRRHLVERFYAEGILEKELRSADFDGMRRIIQRSRHAILKWIRKRG